MKSTPTKEVEWVVPADALARAYDHIAHLRGLLVLYGAVDEVRESIEQFPQVADGIRRLAKRNGD